MAPPRFRPKVTPALLQWALVDVIGMVVLAIGGLYLLRDQSILPGFPSSTLEAVAIVVVGLGLIFAAAVKMLAEIMAQRPQSGQGGKPGQE